MAKGPDAAGGHDCAPMHLAATCAGHSKAVASVRFSPSGSLVASGSADASIRLWRTDGGADASPSAPMAHAGGVNDVAWNPQGSYVASASDDLTAKIWDAETGSCLATLSGHTHYVFCLHFDPVGHILVSGRQQPASRRLAHALARMRRACAACCASRSLRTRSLTVRLALPCASRRAQATGSFDETIRFWDVRSGRCLRELPAHSDPVTAMDFSHDASVLASCSFDGLLRLWDTHNGHCLKTLAIDNGSSPLSLVRFSPNSEWEQGTAAAAGPRALRVRMHAWDAC